MHYNSGKIKRERKKKKNPAEALVIPNPQSTGLVAVLQVTFREAPDWWVAQGQCDYLTLAVKTKFHFWWAPKLFTKQRLLKHIKYFSVLLFLSHGTRSLTPETHQTNITLFRGFRVLYLLFLKSTGHRFSWGWWCERLTYFLHKQGRTYDRPFKKFPLSQVTFFLII